MTSKLGDAETALIAELYPYLRSFASVVAPAEEDPNDLVQEALFRTLRGGPLSRLEFPKAYLRTAIYHLAVSARRHWAAQERALLLVAADVPATETPWQVDELLHLSAKARAVLYLHVIDRAPYGEIADLLGCSVESVRQTASRARRALQGVLAEEVTDATA
jgi:RNA polymerase sigma factor (sigma-70 family)